MSESATRAKPSRPTRIAGDLGESLELILTVLGESSAEYLDPLIRAQIENDRRAYSTAIEAKLAADEAVRIAREQAARQREEGPVMANQLDEAGA